MKKAVIYQPSKTAMSSGNAKTKFWFLEFEPADVKEIDPLMGWTSSKDTQSQVRIKFKTKELAIDYAERHDIDYSVYETKARKPNIRPNGYAENFSHNRKGSWTH
jgi:NADH dehydrogenase